MRDVAKLAQVGTMTVSRVLSGTVRVSEGTSRRVRRAIEELQYQPNQLARALRGSRSHTIGVLMPYLYDPFFATCAHSINLVARLHSYSVIITTTNEDPATELEEARQMMRRQVDGLIIIPASGASPALSAAEFHDLPIVAFDRPVPRSNFDCVGCDNRTGGRIATEHLLGHAHRRICCIALSKSLYTIRTRANGYESAMKNAGLNPETFFDCTSEEAVLEVLRSLWKRKSRPTALLTTNGLTTRFALQGMAALGISIPADMAIVGFDDLELAEVLSPPLTVVRQPVQALGRLAAEILFERLSLGGAVLPRRKVMLPVDLLIRGSCGCNAMDTDVRQRRAKLSEGEVRVPRLLSGTVPPGKRVLGSGRRAARGAVGIARTAAIQANELAVGITAGSPST